jgi:uncharacterized damage-inducible protein DinB
MSPLDMIRTLISYNKALNQKLWESVMELTDEQFTQELPYSHGSVRDQMVHLAAVEERWLAGLKNDPAARRISRAPQDFPTRESAYDLWETVVAKVDAYMDTLSVEEFNSRPRGMRGPIWQVLLHMVNHGTDHRAQVLRALHEFGAPTFDQDLIIHLWSRP